MDSKLSVTEVALSVGFGFAFDGDCDRCIAVDGNGNVVDGGIEEQTHRVCQNLALVLSTAGCELTDVVKTTCFLKEMSDFAAFNAVYAQYFTAKPARSCVAVKQLPKDVLVEIETICVK